MKKNLSFYALFALCCVLISVAGTTNACLFTWSYWKSTIAPSGQWQDTPYGTEYQWTADGDGTFTITGGANGLTTLPTEITHTIIVENGNPASGCLYAYQSDANAWGDITIAGLWYNMGDSIPLPADGDYFIEFYSGGSYNSAVPVGYIRAVVSGGVASPPAYAPPPASIIITAPTTGTTITSTATNLVGNWEGIDPAIYHNITLYFNSNFIGEQSVAKIISVGDWTGNFIIPLSYFGLSANGQWDLKGNATFANTQLSDMYITTDLISPSGYNLIFNVSGFHTPYSFTDFNTWYSANVSNYGSPSSWASGMIGYLQPILEKIAEFGARIQDYLDTSTAWQRGNDIGSVFPVVNAYILKINIFFGGFPIAQFFQWGILIMIGMFAIKIILKLLSFIPVIGGGG